jgi:hypothetical protein
MLKTFLSFGLIGILVAAGLTAYSYHINRTPGLALMSPAMLLIMCPPSIFLVATEHASVSGQVFIIALTLVANGVIYGVGAMLARRLLEKTAP